MMQDLAAFRGLYRPQLICDIAHPVNQGAIPQLVCAGYRGDSVPGIAAKSSCIQGLNSRRRSVKRRIGHARNGWADAHWWPIRDRPWLSAILESPSSEVKALLVFLLAP
jgi:hypothetical protein